MTFSTSFTLSAAPPSLPDRGQAILDVPAGVYNGGLLTVLGDSLGADAIVPDNQQAWRVIVFLRNDVSHLNEQRAYSVGMLLQQVQWLTSVINRLFRLKMDLTSTQTHDGSPSQ